MEGTVTTYNNHSSIQENTLIEAKGNGKATVISGRRKIFLNKSQSIYRSIAFLILIEA